MSPSFKHDTIDHLNGNLDDDGYEDDGVRRPEYWVGKDRLIVVCYNDIYCRSSSSTQSIIILPLIFSDLTPPSPLTIATVHRHSQPLLHTSSHHLLQSAAIHFTSPVFAINFRSLHFRFIKHADCFCYAGSYGSL
ncbi:hypothetical protein QVD17_15082 [Tagetes erecta]|uniref:Uncharacterized protein n=1 Tax=Tagetes erecta TaxID=13708 RepID=A0AAD8KSP2_TARER|nr:hypothetical protein QVD17_15082 [Tagetes erecta]